jgi:hypothetical protein
MKIPFPRPYRPLLCALAACFAAAPALAQGLDNKGRDFLMAFQPNNYGGQTVQLHLTGDVATNVTVEYPATDPSFSQMVSVTPGAVTIVSLPVAAASSWTSDTVSGNTVRASAPDEFVAYMINLQTATSDAALALPIDALNTEYFVIDWPGYSPQFTVFAAFDATTVTITPTVAIGNHPAGTPFDVTLNRGQAYFTQGSSSFTGTLISANRPVGLTNGNSCTDIPGAGGGGACDHIFEVAQPVQSWGTSIPVANLPSRPLGSIYRIVASQDGTQVSLDGSPLGGVLNRGDVLQTQQTQLPNGGGPTDLAGNHLFTANHPIFVVQFMTGSPTGSTDDGDPAMGNMVPSDQYGNHYTFATLTQTQFPLQYLTVIADSRDVATITLDGTAIGASAFSAIGSTGLSAAVLPLAAGTHNTSSVRPHGITVEGFGYYDSYLYPGGARFAFINPVGDANPPLCTLVQVEPSQFDGSAQDDRPSEDTNGNGELDEGEDLNDNGEIDEDTGIFSIELLEGAQNLVLSVDEFVPGDGEVGFSVFVDDSEAPFSGSVRVSDGAGNTCERTVGAEEPYWVELADLPFADWGEDVEVRIELDSQDQEIRTAYVAAQEEGVKILDVTDPSAIVQLGSFDPATCSNGGALASFFADDVELVEELDALFVAAGRCGVIVLDVSDPTAPTQIGQHNTPVWAEAVAIDLSSESPLGYIADHNGGLQIVDFGDVFDAPSGAPDLLSSMGSSTSGWGTGAAIDVAFRDDGEEKLVYVAASQGLRIVDVDSPSSPVLRGGYDTAPGSPSFEVPQDVELDDSGNVAILAAWQGGLLVIDVSSSSEPFLTQQIPTELAYYETSIVGGRVFATEGQLGVRSFELVEGELQALDDGVGVPIAGGEGWAWDIQVVEGLTYVTYGILAGTSGTGGLAILEFVDPESELRFASLEENAVDLDADGIGDEQDNCTSLANASQLDADADGYGNACDADFDGDGAVGITDFGRLKAAFGALPGDARFDAAVDLDGDGAIGLIDFGVLKARFGSAPGPSGLACAGSTPCP